MKRAAYTSPFFGACSAILPGKITLHCLTSFFAGISRPVPAIAKIVLPLLHALLSKTCLMPISGFSPPHCAPVPWRAIAKSPITSSPGFEPISRSCVSSPNYAATPICWVGFVVSGQSAIPCRPTRATSSSPGSTRFRRGTARECARHYRCLYRDSEADQPRARPPTRGGAVRESVKLRRGRSPALGLNEIPIMSFRGAACAAQLQFAGTHRRGRKRGAREFDSDQAGRTPSS